MQFLRVPTTPDRTRGRLKRRLEARSGAEPEASLRRTGPRGDPSCLYTYEGLIIAGEYLDRGQSRPLPRESLTPQVVIILMNFKQHQPLASRPYKLPSCASLIGLCDDLFATRDVPLKRNPLAIFDMHLFCMPAYDPMIDAVISSRKCIPPSPLHPSLLTIRVHASRRIQVATRIHLPSISRAKK